MEQGEGETAIEPVAARPGLARRIVAYPLSLAVIGGALLVGVAIGTSMLVRLAGSSSRGGLPDVATALLIAAAVGLEQFGDSILNSSNPVFGFLTAWAIRGQYT